MDEAILMPTGKGFALTSALNLRQVLLNGYECHTRRSDEDPDSMPVKRQKRYCLPKLKIAVMTNDTVATLASLAYSIRSLRNTRVVMGLIVGAGCNSTVPMRIADLHESKTHHIRIKDPDAVETLISTEWTLRGATAPLQELSVVTKWDTELDVHSKRPGFQPLEYMVGGRYIGELVRIICYDWFHGVLGIPRPALPLKLVEEYSLTSSSPLLWLPVTLTDNLLVICQSNFHRPHPVIGVGRPNLQVIFVPLHQQCRLDQLLWWLL